jgi:proteasome lid subunit RPN8/RPN11
MDLPAEIRRAMVVHAESCLPDEACGLLAADAAGRLRTAYCLSNATPSPSAYTLDPGEHFRALRSAEAQGWHLAGVFHSHPRGPAVPSPTDAAQAFEPEWLYVVVSLEPPGAPEVRGFWIRGGLVTEEPLLVVSGAVNEVPQ